MNTVASLCHKKDALQCWWSARLWIDLSAEWSSIASSFVQFSRHGDQDVDLSWCTIWKQGVHLTRLDYWGKVWIHPFTLTFTHDRHNNESGYINNLYTLIKRPSLGFKVLLKDTSITCMQASGILPMFILGASTFGPHFSPETVWMCPS